MLPNPFRDQGETQALPKEGGVLETNDKNKWNEIEWNG